MSARRVSYVLSFDVPADTPDEHVADILNAAFVQVDEARTQDDEEIATDNVREIQISEADAYSLESILDVVADGIPEDLLARLEVLVDVLRGGVAR